MKSKTLKALLVFIGAVFLFTIGFGEKIELKKASVMDSKAIKFKGFTKIKPVIDSKVDGTKYHAFRYACDNNTKIIVKVKASIKFQDAEVIGKKTAASNKCKLPRIMSFYDYSYGCNNMVTNKWDTFVNEEDWTTDIDAVEKRAEAITEKKKKENPKAYKMASCGGGGSSSSSRDTELNLKEKNIKIVTAQNVVTTPIKK